jgi:hypothetical protein
LISCFIVIGSSPENKFFQWDYTWFCDGFQHIKPICVTEFYVISQKPQLWMVSPLPAGDGLTLKKIRGTEVPLTVL